MPGSGAAKPRRTHQPSTNARSSSCSDSAISAECGWGLAVLPSRARRSTASPVARSTRSGSLEGIHPRCNGRRRRRWPLPAPRRPRALGGGGRCGRGHDAGVAVFAAAARCGGPVAGARSPPTTAHPPFRHVPVGTWTRGRAGYPQLPPAVVQWLVRDRPPTTAHPPLRHVPVEWTPGRAGYPPLPPRLCSGGRRSRGPGRL